MSIRHIFTVKQNKHAEPVTFQANLPKTAEDTDLIRERFGSMERMIECANRQWTVDVAVGIRKRLPDTDAAQQYAEAYCDNGSKDAYVKVVKIDSDEAEAHGFTPEQMAFLKTSGVKVD